MHTFTRVTRKMWNKSSKSNEYERDGSRLQRGKRKKQHTHKNEIVESSENCQSIYFNFSSLDANWVYEFWFRTWRIWLISHRCHLTEGFIKKFPTHKPRKKRNYNVQRIYLTHCANTAHGFHNSDPNKNQERDKKKRKLTTPTTKRKEMHTQNKRRILGKRVPAGRLTGMLQFRCAINLYGFLACLVIGRLIDLHAETPFGQVSCQKRRPSNILLVECAISMPRFIFILILIFYYFNATKNEFRRFSIYDYYDDEICYCFVVVISN